MFKGDVVKTCQHILLHCFKGPHMASSPESKLCCAPVLLDEIELAMIFWIEVAQVTTRFDVLLEQWFLRHEVSLSEEKMATAATGLSLRTLVASTFNRESRLGPKAMLTDYLFHSLKPPQIMGVVIWEIKGLQFLGQGINPIMHAWPVWMECPGALWILGVHHRHRYSKIELKDSLLTIFLVEMASTARFR